MDLIQFPFVRLQYPSINNPLFIGDIVAANQQALTALTSVAGLGPTDFAIFQGLTYNLASPSNYYSPGIFYLNGVWYYMPTQFNENQYLLPNITNAMPEVFQDTVSRNIYQIQYAQAQVSGGAGASPLMLGNMNAYRMDNKTLAAQVALLNTAVFPLVKTGLTLTSAYTVFFTQDQILDFSTASVNTVISLSALGAVPGTVVRLRWTFGGGLTVAVTAVSGQTIYRDSGFLSLAASNTNTMYILYTGKNESGNDEWSYSINQTAYP